ncbi:MAG: hypothetical protein P8I94_07200 [Emcibacteraceae bacterium]|nr:hypothetical protein [Emcibacteraceae bacterium]
MKIFKTVILVIFGFVLLLLVGPIFIDIVFDKAASIDGCLDSGGMWDYENEECIYEIKKPDD